MVHQKNTFTEILAVIIRCYALDKTHGIPMVLTTEIAWNIDPVKRAATNQMDEESVSIPQIPSLLDLPLFNPLLI